MHKVIYVHGLGSSSNSSTGKYLKENLKDCTVLTPDIPFSPKDGYRFVQEYITKEKPNLVIGSSLGGFYVLNYALERFKGNKLLINPAMRAYDDIKNSIGLGAEYDINGEKRAIDISYLDQLKAIQDDFYVRRYNRKDYADNTYALFGTKDELFSHIEDFKTYFDETKMRVVPTGHKLKEDELHYITEFANEILYRE